MDFAEVSTRLYAEVVFSFLPFVFILHVFILFYFGGQLCCTFISVTTTCVLLSNVLLAGLVSVKGFQSNYRCAGN